MAQTWEEYFSGSPEQAAADAAAREQDYRRVAGSEAYRSLRDAGPFADLGRMVDPRELRMAMIMDSLPQSRLKTTDAARDAGHVADYALSSGQRMRDTSLRGLQELANGNFGDAAALSLRSPLAAFYPPAAAGTPGSPDDWRPKARAAGVPEHHILAFDIGTDPETWISAPVSGPAAFVVPALQYKAVRALANSDTALRALQASRRASRAMDALRGGETLAPLLLK